MVSSYFFKNNESNRSNNFAISSDGIATALKDSASSLMAANNSYQESVALIAAANRVVQDPSNVGAALRTISLRLRGTSTKELEEAGEDTVGVVESKSKLRTKIQGYTGIDILTDSGAYKSTYEILLEISKVWDDLTDQDRAGLLELIAGKTRSNAAAAILSNTKDLEKAYKSAMEAEGSALRENEKYLDSIQGKIDQFNNAIQTMWSNTLDSDAVKMIVELGTKLIKIVDKLGLVQTIVFGLMAKWTVFSKNKIDLASILGIRDIEKGWTFGKEGFTGWFKKQFGKKSSITESIIGNPKDVKVDAKAYAEAIGDNISDYVKIDTSEIDTQIDGITQRLSVARDQLADVKAKDWDYYKSLGSATPAKDRDNRIVEKQKEVAALEQQLTELQTKRSDMMSKAALKYAESTMPPKTSKYLDIFTNGLGKGSNPLNVNFDTLAGKLKEIEGLDGEGLRSYMNNLEDLGDEADDTNIALAGYVSTVEDGNYTIQGAQKYVRQYNQGLVDMSRQAQKAQLQQNLLNLAISAVTMLLAAGITALINAIAKAQDEFEELSSQLAATKSDLDSINSELEGTKEKIKELEEQGTLLFTDQEELERLKAISAELERQKGLKEGIQQQQQKGVNSASVKAANDYYKKTGKNSGKTTGEMTGEGAKYGLMVGGAAAGIVASSLAVGATNIWNPIGWAALVLAAITAIGAGIGAVIGATEEKVGQTMDDMREQYTQLQEEYNEAQRKYATETSDGNYKKMQKAQEKLIEYESMMANNFAQMDAYYSQIDLSVYDPVKDAEEIKRLRTEMNEFYDTQDKWLIQSKTANAKENAISRIFGENADDQLKRVKTKIEQAVEAGEDIDIEAMFGDTEAYNAFVTRLRTMGIYLYEVENYFQEVAEAESEFVDTSLEDVVKDINKITDGLESLKTAFDEVIDKGILTAKTIASIKESLSIGTDDTQELTDAWNYYLETMMSGTATTEDMIDATERLAQAWVEDTLANNDLTPERRMEIVAQLHSLGVTNAEEYVDDILQKNMKNDLEGKMNSADQKIFDQYEEWINKTYPEATESQRKAWVEAFKQQFLRLNAKGKAGYIRDLEAQEGIDFDEYEFNDEVIKDMAEAYGVEESAIQGVIDKLEEKAKLENNMAQAKSTQKAYESWLNDDGGYKASKENLDGLINDDTYQTALKIKEVLDDPDLYLTDLPEGIYEDHGFWRQSYYHFNGDKYDTYSDWSDAVNRYLIQYQKKIDEAQATFDKVIEEGKAKGYVNEDGTLKEGVDAEFEAAYKAAEDGVKTLENEIDTELTANIAMQLDLQDPSEQIDQLQDLFNTLQDAVNEFNENDGNLSVDTVQSLLELDVGDTKYLTLLTDENGQLQLNKESLIEVAKARMMDLGVKKATNLIDTMENALNDDKIEKARELTTVTYGLTESSWALVESEAARVAILMAEKGMTAEEIASFTSQISAIQQLTNNAIAGLPNSLGGSTISEQAEDEFQKIMDHWDNRISANEAKYDQIQNDIDWLENQGKMADAAYYKDQLDLLTQGEDSKEQLLTNKLNAAKDRLDELTAAGKEGSDEWWDAAEIYNSTLSELDDVRDTVIELQDAIGDLEWSKFEEFNTRLDDINSKLETMRDLIAPDGEEDWFDDEGNWTEKGVAVLGSYVQSLEYYKKGLNEAGVALDEFNNIGNGAKWSELSEAQQKEYADTYGIHSEQEYYDYLKKLTDEQYKYAQSVSDTEQDIADMYESSIDAAEEYIDTLIDSYNDYIDVVKESLDAERDLYNFKKDVAKQTKDIGQLERRIAALSGSTNAADIAERRKLEAELAEQREALNDTYYEHSMDSQQEALDKEAEAYEEAMNKFVENLRDNLDLALEDMGSFIAGVTSAVTANAPIILDEYGKLEIALDDAIVAPWQAAKDKMADYTKEDGLGLMNSWVAEGGVFDTFANNATDYLTSIWTDTNVDPDNAFSDAVTSHVEGITESIRQNVETAKGYLTDLYSVADTSKTYTGGGGGGTPETTGSQFLSKETKVDMLPQYLDSKGNIYYKVQGMNDAYVSKAQTVNKSGILYAPKGTLYYGLDEKNLKQKTYAPNSSAGGGGRIDRVSMYAKGTMGTTHDQLAITDESWIGEEITLAAGKNGQLQYLKKGSAVMPADISANLVEWGKLNPNMMKIGGGANINMISNAVNKPELNFEFDSLVHVDHCDEGTLKDLEKMVDNKINQFTKRLNYSLKGIGAK